MTRGEFRQEFLSRLQTLYDPREAGAMLRWYLLDQCGLEYHLFVLDAGVKMPDNINYLSDLQRLENGEPLQYVVGFTEFHGLRFRTDSRALIPRPETEELVDLILREQRHCPDLRVLDIGTGTGAIAITLAHELPTAQVDALDISADALALAKENAQALHANVNFIHEDILRIDSLSKKYDIIVSNPPYIPESKRPLLHRNVTAFEPAVALFVPDRSPLLFYEKIAELASKAMTPGVKVYFETYEDFHLELTALLKRNKFLDIRCLDDISGKPRFVTARRG